MFNTLLFCIEQSNLAFMGTFLSKRQSLKTAKWTAFTEQKFKVETTNGTRLLCQQETRYKQ